MHGAALLHGTWKLLMSEKNNPLSMVTSWISIAFTCSLGLSSSIVNSTHTFQPGDVSKVFVAIILRGVVTKRGKGQASPPKHLRNHILKILKPVWKIIGCSWIYIFSNKDSAQQPLNMLAPPHKVRILATHLIIIHLAILGCSICRMGRNYLLLTSFCIPDLKVYFGPLFLTQNYTMHQY